MDGTHHERDTDFRGREPVFGVGANERAACVLSYGNRHAEKNKNNIVEYYYNDDNNNDDDEDNKNSNKTAENISIIYSL